MRRKSMLLLLIVLLAATSATGVSASTNCERWITAYKTELAHTRAIKRMKAAHARMRRYAQHKLANYVPKPARPKVILTHAVRPRYTRQQIRDRFNLLCGDLPGTGNVADKLLQGTMTPVEFAADRVPSVPEELASVEVPGFIGPADGPAEAPTGTSQPETPPFFGSVPPIFGGGGSGGNGGSPKTPTGPSNPTNPVTPPTAPPSTPPVTPPTTPPTTPPGTPVTPPTTPPDTPPVTPPDTPPVTPPDTPPVTPPDLPPGGPTPPDQPPSPVPEPSSIVLMLTGVAGAAGAIRRRMQG